MAYDRLTALDASFLHLERLETPMHVGALTVLEGEPFFGPADRFRLAEVRDLVASRLHLIPRFRKKVMSVPLDAGQPIWIDDERFDIGYHVRLTALPAPGSRSQLLALFERVQAQMLDRSRPLWELWFVEGLEGGNVAVIQKTHHALVDGISGVDVATVLFDFTPEPTIPEAPEWVPESAPSSRQLLFDTLSEGVAEVARVQRAITEALQVPRRVLHELGGRRAHAGRAADDEDALAVIPKLVEETHGSDPRSTSGTGKLVELACVPLGDPGAFVVGNVDQRVGQHLSAVRPVGIVVREVGLPHDLVDPDEIAVPDLLVRLDWPHKRREGRFVFLCPLCAEFLTATNPRTNLGRCFACERNFNPIDLAMLIRGVDFVTAVHYLETSLPSRPSH